MPALGTFFPRVAGWNELIPDGAVHTVSADGETATLTDAVRTRSYDVGTTLARIQWDGTATGTIKGRTSASRIARTDDYGPIQPGDSEWAYKYDGSLGTAPTSQGWSKTGSITETLAGGTLRMESAGAAYWAINPASSLNNTDELSVIRVGVTINAGHVGSFSVLAINGTKSTKITLTGSAFGSDANRLFLGDTYYVPGLTLTTGTAFDFLIATRRGTISDSRIFVKARGSDDRYTLVGMIDEGAMPTPADAQNLVLFGTFSGSGMDVTIDHLGIYSGSEWETVTDGDTSFARNQRHWQFKGWQSGTLTGLDIASDLSAPSATGAPTANEISDTALGSAWSAVAGAAAYLVNTVNTGTSTIVDSQWVTGTVSATDGLSAGTYRHDVYAASDDGVRSATAGESNTVTLPATTATAPTIGPYPRWVSGELRFYKPTAGSSSLTGGTYAVLSASQAAGAYSVADSTSWASITWRATDGTGQYVTADDLGLSVSATTWYRDRITDSGNLVAEGQTAVYGGDEDTATCIVTFSGLTAGTTVSCKLSAPVTVNGTTYPVYQTSYTTTVAVDGTASLTLPRCNAGTNQEGSGTVYGYFTGGDPQAFVLQRRIPDAATATFASLSAP